MLDITVKCSVEVPQLAELQQAMVFIGANIVSELQELNEAMSSIVERGGELMSEITGIQEAINTLVTNQASGQEALAAHLTAIEEEIRQLGESPSQADLDELAEQVRAAAATAAKGAEELRAMTAQVSGMVPDAPAPEPPA
jgi:chromosome segregation ATPase